MLNTHKKICLGLLTVLVAALLVVAGVFVLAPSATAAAETDSSIALPDNHNHATMTPLSACPSNGKLTEGAYYLTDDVNDNITVTGNVTLCLNGHNVQGNGEASVITVSQNATFTLCDCQGTGCITGGHAAKGGGVYVDSGAFEMFGGKISGNTADFGGGVYIYDCTFEMFGGEIIGNTAKCGGGLNIDVRRTGADFSIRAKFTMSGGKISNNTGKYIDGSSTVGNGGGVNVQNGTVEINGGEISQNESPLGAGLYLNGKFTMTSGKVCDNIGVGLDFHGSSAIMSGGEISGNTKGGLYIGGGTFEMSDGIITANGSAANGYGVSTYSGTFRVYGTPKITGNKRGDSNYNFTGRYGITVKGVLTEGAQIGVNKTGEVISGFTQEDKPNEFFFSDDPANGCIYVSDSSTGKVTIGEHIGGTATCVSGAQCSLCGEEYGEVDSTNHIWDEGAVTTKPTCTDEGEKTFTCTLNSEHTRTESVDALGGEHEYEQEFTIDQEPTCTTAGSKSKHCTRCDSAIDVTEIPALGHDYGEWTVVKQATQDEEGAEQRVCSRDSSHVETRPIPKLPATDPSTEPTEQPSDSEWIWTVLFVMLLVIVLCEVFYLVYILRLKYNADSNGKGVNNK